MKNMPGSDEKTQDCRLQLKYACFGASSEAAVELMV